MVATKTNQWTSEEMFEFTQELEADLENFDKITCGVCGITYSLMNAIWIDGTLPCPTCGHIEGENFE